jgi:hypothetical protein
MFFSIRFSSHTNIFS